ncbi:GNAT family N-acetyltransferase [Pseudomonas protegens]|uniref:GNAT family N-acetyltransferase n=1 Tax=Pseudomonas protegens TaxID=380021 RepID=A0A7G7XC01_9PSED|nr:GNAT family N-acetyltransferase [Pseudomonas protegens]QNH77496.1 GNAT family N-acetyltransferase [Pseudomonas protegens]QNL06692.1 GNAT family N-acetyltransferase [Pseudomonas protegens]
MSSITLFQAPPPETIQSQIQQMVVDYITDISAVAIAPSNPLYNLYQYGVGYEVHLYQPVKDDPQACAVAYMAVLQSHRRQGIARQMLEALRACYPHAELACHLAEVECFEALGFQVLGARGPQVLMNTRDHGSDGLLAVLDVAPIYQSVEVRQIYTYLLVQNGRKAMLEAEKTRDGHLDQMTRQAQALVSERLGEAALVNAPRAPRLIWSEITFKERSAPHWRCR